MRKKKIHHAVQSLILFLVKGSQAEKSKYCREHNIDLSDICAYNSLYLSMLNLFSISLCWPSSNKTSCHILIMSFHSRHAHLFLYGLMIVSHIWVVRNSIEHDWGMWWRLELLAWSGHLSWSPVQRFPAPPSTWLHSELRSLMQTARG